MPTHHLPHHLDSLERMLAREATELWRSEGGAYRIYEMRGVVAQVL